MEILLSFKFKTFKPFNRYAPFKSFISCMSPAESVPTF